MEEAKPVIRLASTNLSLPEMLLTVPRPCYGASDHTLPALRRNHPIQHRIIRKRTTRVYLSALGFVARQRCGVEVGMALDSLARDGVALADIAQQFDQGGDLRFGERVAPVAVVDELDGDGALAVVVDVMGDLGLWDAGSQGAIAVDHVVDAEHGVRFDVAQVVVQGACADPDGLAGCSIAGGAAGGVDNDHGNGLRANGSRLACLGIASDKRKSRCERRHQQRGQSPQLFGLRLGQPRTFPIHVVPHRAIGSIAVENTGQHEHQV